MMFPVENFQNFLSLSCLWLFCCCTPLPGKLFPLKLTILPGPTPREPGPVVKPLIGAPSDGPPNPNALPLPKFAPPPPPRTSDCLDFLVTGPVAEVDGLHEAQGIAKIPLPAPTAAGAPALFEIEEGAFAFASPGPVSGERGRFIPYIPAGAGSAYSWLASFSASHFAFSYSNWLRIVLRSQGGIC